MAMCTASLAALVSASIHDHFSEAKKTSELCHSSQCPHPDCDIPEKKKKKEEDQQGNKS